MRFKFRSHTDDLPESHEAALLQIGADITAAAQAWRRGERVSLIDPPGLIRSLESHLAALDSPAAQRGNQATTDGRFPDPLAGLDEIVIAIINTW